MKNLLKKYRRRLRLKGTKFLLAKGLATLLHKVWRVSWSNLFSYDIPHFSVSFPHELTPQFRRLSLSDFSTMPKELQPSRTTIESRLNQKAVPFAASWRGRVLDCCWLCWDHDFTDIGDKFYIPLQEGQCYFFDYGSVQAERPMAFSGFRLMRGFVNYMCREVEEETGRAHRFYSIVDQKNRNSTAFHKRYLRDVRVISVLRQIQFLSWKWTPAESRKELDRAIRHDAARLASCPGNTLALD